MVIGEDEDCSFGLLADQTSKIFKAVGLSTLTQAVIDGASRVLLYLAQAT